MDFNRSVVLLQDLCLLTVNSYLSPSNVWSIHRLVPYVYCPRIDHIVHSFICDNFMDISHTDQFLALDEKEMQWLLDNQDIKVSEAAMLDSLARWYKHKEKQRENAFKQLFEKLHLSVIGKDVLSEVIKKYQLVKVIPELRKYKKLLPQRVSLDDLIFQENISNMAVISVSREYVEPTIIAPEFFGNSEPPLFEYLPFQTGVIHYWVPFASQSIEVELKTLGKDLFASYMVPCKDKLYIFGSTRQSLDSTMLEPIAVYIDLHTRSFHKCSTPPDILPSQGVCLSSASYVFILGGYGYDPSSATDSSDPLDYMKTQTSQSVYKYDHIKDKWTDVAPSVHQHVDFQTWGTQIVVLYKDRFLYIFHSRLCERYDMCTNTWSLVAPPLVDIDYFFCANVLDERIIVFGVTAEGFEDSTKCFAVYNVVSNSWQQPCIFPPSVSLITRAFFGKNFALAEAFHKGREFLQEYKASYSISELQFPSGKTGKLMACSKKKLDFKLSSRMNVFEYLILSRGLRLLAV